MRGVFGLYSIRIKMYNERKMSGGKTTKERFIISAVLKTSLPIIDISDDYEYSEYIPGENRMHIQGSKEHNEVVFRLAHEMRHKWQWENERELYFSDYEELGETSIENYGKQKAEIDANAFAMIISAKLLDDIPVFKEYPYDEKKQIFDRAQELTTIYNIDIPWKVIYEMYL